MKSSTFVILTATQESLGGYGSQANVAATHNLWVYLRAHNYDYSIVRGVYNGVDQGPSFILWNVSAGEGLRLASELQQESIIVSTPTGSGLLYLDGRGYVRSLGELYGVEAELTGNYTMQPDGIAFSLILS